MADPESPIAVPMMGPACWANGTPRAGAVAGAEDNGPFRRQTPPQPSKDECDSQNHLPRPYVLVLVCTSPNCPRSTNAFLACTTTAAIGSAGGTNRAGAGPTERLL